MEIKEEEEPKFCICCGKRLDAKDIRQNCGFTESQCKNCGNLLRATPVRCMGTGCKGENLFLPLLYPSMDFEHKSTCPLCGETGQFAEVISE